MTTPLGGTERSRAQAVAEALASVRAERLEPSPEGLERLARVARGELTPEEAVEETLAPYRASSDSSD